MILKEDLFQKDIFSFQEPKYESVPEKVGEEVEALLGKAFSSTVKKIKTIKQVKGNEVNSQNFKIETDDKAFLLKKRKRFTKSEKQVFENQQELIKEARKEHLYFPKSLPSEMGDPIISDEKSSWALFEFIPGSYLGNSFQDLFNVAYEQGKLYRFFEHFQPESFYPQAREYFTPGEIEVFQIFQDKNEKGAWDFDSKVEQDLRTAWDLIASFYEDVFEKWQSIQSFHKPSLCHFDIHPHNLLIERSGRITFLDGDAVVLGHPFACLGLSMFKLIRNYISYQSIQPPAPFEITKQFIEHLEKGSFSTFTHLKLGAQLEVLKRILYILNDFHKNESVAWLHVLPIHLRSIFEINILFDSERKE